MHLQTQSNINDQVHNWQLAIMSDKNTSTLQSYVDSASGAVQSAIGSLTGNTSDQVFPAFTSNLSASHHVLTNRRTPAKPRKTKPDSRTRPLTQPPKLATTPLPPQEQSLKTTPTVLKEVGIKRLAVPRKLSGTLLVLRFVFLPLPPPKIY